jgi:hypothetical protein
MCRCCTVMHVGNSVYVRVVSSCCRIDFVVFPVSPQGLMMSGWHDITRFRLWVLFITTAVIPVNPTNDRDTCSPVYRYGGVTEASAEVRFSLI